MKQDPENRSIKGFVVRKASRGKLRNDYICYWCRDVWLVVAVQGMKGVGVRKLECWSAGL